MALTASLAGCSALNVFGNGGEPERDAETQEITESGQADVFSIKIGDCLDETAADEVTDVPVVPCGDPHDQEVFSEFFLSGDEWPGADVIQSESLERCDAAFATFVGVAWDDSELDWFPFTPTEGSWGQNNDRLVQCVVFDPAGKTTGTLKGAAR